MYEQTVQLTSASGETWTLRRVTVKLKAKTRNGDTALTLLPNLPSTAAAAITITALYRTRWGIETAFQKLESYLNSEMKRWVARRRRCLVFGTRRVQSLRRGDGGVTRRSSHAGHR
ncbi:MAG: transposase [Chromatiaceae bacterium]|nr:transposase [Chromatiaceae bacterium]